MLCAYLSQAKHFRCGGSAMYLPHRSSSSRHRSRRAWSSRSQGPSRQSNRALQRHTPSYSVTVWHTEEGRERTRVRHKQRPKRSLSISRSTIEALKPRAHLLIPLHLYRATCPSTAVTMRPVLNLFFLFGSSVG